VKFLLPFIFNFTFIIFGSIFHLHNAKKNLLQGYIRLIDYSYQYIDYFLMVCALSLHELKAKFTSTYTWDCTWFL